MTTIYLIHTADDLYGFLQRNPTITWVSGGLVSISNFPLNPFVPIALYVNRSDGLSWNPLASGELDLQNEPDKYKLGGISPILPYGNIFTTFLKHHDAYEEFIAQDFEYTTNIQFSQLLIDTFEWDVSFDGYEYWDNLDHKWQDLIKDLKLNPREVIPNLLNILR